MQTLEIEARFNSILEDYGELLRRAIAYHFPGNMGLSYDDIVQEARLPFAPALAGRLATASKRTPPCIVAEPITAGIVRSSALPTVLTRPEQGGLLWAGPALVLEVNVWAHFAKKNDPFSHPSCVTERRPNADA